MRDNDLIFILTKNAADTFENAKKQSQAKLIIDYHALSIKYSKIYNNWFATILMNLIVIFSSISLDRLTQVIS